MKRFLILALVLSGCSFAKIPFRPNTATDYSTDWKAYASDGVTIKTVGTGFSTDLPSGSGHLNYVYRPGKAKVGSTLHVKYRITKVSGKPEVTSLDPAVGLPPNCRPMLAVDIAGSRWWANPPNTVGQFFFKDLGDKQSVEGELVIPVQPQNFAGVYGENYPNNKKQFTADIPNVQYVCITCGGGGSYGHGIRVKNGVIRLEILEYTFK